MHVHIQITRAHTHAHLTATLSHTHSEHTSNTHVQTSTHLQALGEGGGGADAGIQCGGGDEEDGEEEGRLEGLHPRQLQVQPAARVQDLRRKRTARGGSGPRHKIHTEESL